MPIADKSLLEAALAGYEQQHAKILEAMAAIRSQLRGNRPATSAANAPEAPRKRRRLSAAARKRIAAAQKKRWAAFHKQQKAA